MFDVFNCLVVNEMSCDAYVVRCMCLVEKPLFWLGLVNDPVAMLQVRTLAKEEAPCGAGKSEKEKYML